MIGFARPLSRYAVPRSVMNAVGECVCRDSFGLSAPCGETEPPITNADWSTALIASKVRASSLSYAIAATSWPFGPNWGSQ